MQTKVPAPSDTKPTGDWREGLVVLPADHVYGATARDAEWWAERDATHKHGVYAVYEFCAHSGVPVMDHHRHLSHASLFAELHHLIEMTPGAFEPARGPFRLDVKEEW